MLIKKNVYYIDITSTITL